MFENTQQLAAAVIVSKPDKRGYQAGDLRCVRDLQKLLK